MIILRPHTPWHTPQLKNEKHTKRKLERKWRRTRLEIDHQIYRVQCCKLNVMLNNTKRLYYSKKVVEAGSDRKALFSITNGLLQKNGPSPLPSFGVASELADKFAEYFHGKILLIRDELAPDRVPCSSIPDVDNTSVPNKLAMFTLATDDEVAKLIARSAPKSCELDPLPTWLLKKCGDVLVPVITSVITPWKLQMYRRS